MNRAMRSNRGIKERAEQPTKAPSARVLPNGAKRRSRRGVSAVEGAIVLIVFSLILFTMLDLGLMVLDYNLLCEGASHLCREAVVHGSMAAPQEASWGPAMVSGNVGDGSSYSQAIQQDLVTLPLNEVSYSLEWASNANQPGGQVQATLSYQFTPIIPYVLGSKAISLKAVATMQIIH